MIDVAGVAMAEVLTRNATLKDLEIRCLDTMSDETGVAIARGIHWGAPLGRESPRGMPAAWPNQVLDKHPEEGQQG